MANGSRVFVAGGTGYLGQRMIPELHARGHEVIALTRESSRSKLPGTCTPAVGDALNGDSYSQFVDGCHSFIQLVGVAHPSPAKAEQFRSIDRVAGLEAVRVARKAGVRHFIYVSVAQPAPVMKVYQEVRAEVEHAIAVSGMAATILRPWYVLGPGHLWPCCLLPLYKLAELFPGTRDSALRLGLVTISQMTRALARAADEPREGIRYLGVPGIRGDAAD